jgi:hypothetical protein
MLGSVKNFLHAHLEDHVGMGTDPHTSRCNLPQQRIEHSPVLSLGYWIDPDEHTVATEKLLAHFVSDVVRIDRGFRVNAERRQRFENAIEPIVLCCRLAPRRAIPAPACRRSPRTCTAFLL